jgi:hypothetical protein
VQLKVPPLKLVFKPLDPPAEKRSTRRTHHSSNASENDETSSESAQDCPPKSRSRTYESRRKKINQDEPPPKKVSREDILDTIHEEDKIAVAPKSNEWHTTDDDEDVLKKVSSLKNGNDFAAYSSYGRDFSIDALTKAGPSESKIPKIEETDRSITELPK